MEFHPIAEETPPMADEKFAELVESVRQHGVVVPCWRYEGKILDGRHRYRAAKECGVPIFNWHEFKGTEDEAREFAKLLNDKRRHLSRQDEIEWAKRLRAGGMSIRAIADAVGSHPTQVQRDVKQVYTVCTPETVAEPDSEEDDPRDAIQVQVLQDLEREAAKNDELRKIEQEPKPCPTPSPSSAPSSRASAPAPVPPKVTGLDGKKYAATRPQAKPASKPEPSTRGLTVYLVQLANVATLVNEIATQNLEEGDETWSLVQSLESAAAVLLQKATAIRKKLAR